MDYEIINCVELKLWYWCLTISVVNYMSVYGWKCPCFIQVYSTYLSCLASSSVYRAAAGVCKEYFLCIIQPKTMNIRRNPWNRSLCWNSCLFVDCCDSLKVIQCKSQNCLCKISYSDNKTVIFVLQYCHEMVICGCVGLFAICLVGWIFCSFFVKTKLSVPSHGIVLSSQRRYNYEQEVEFASGNCLH